MHGIMIFMCLGCESYIFSDLSDLYLYVFLVRYVDEVALAVGMLRVLSHSNGIFIRR